MTAKATSYEGWRRGGGEKERERGTAGPGGGQGGATPSAHVPASLGTGDIMYS